MANQTKPPRSFNTIRHSQTKERAKRRQWSRVVLLAMAGVLALILVSLLVLGVWSLADVIFDAIGNDTDGPQGNSPSPGTGDVLYDQPFAGERSDIQHGSLILVNRQTQYHFPQKVSLVNIKEKQAESFINGSRFYVCNNAEMKMEETAFQAFENMMRAYYSISEGDGSVEITAAYRTYNDQNDLYQRNPDYATPPNYSDHHTGMCIALKDGILKKDMEKTHWIMQNCHKYGFIMRYPSEKSDITKVSGYENCLRYVGVAHATYITENGLCLEEYIELLQNNYASGEHLNIVGADGKKYEVYYVPVSGELTTFQVPSNYEYTVSGDNVGGFIVTVHLSAPIAE